MSVLRLAVLFFSGSLLAVGADYYASPDGSPGGEGTSSHPWDLETALSRQSPVDAGDTLYLLGGTYELQFLEPLPSYISGAAGNHVTVRPAPGESVIIDGVIYIYGAWSIFRDLEMMSSYPVRQSSQSGPWATDVHHLAALSVLAPHVKLINNVIHDTGVGIASWVDAPDNEIYGNIVYYVGWQGPDRAHGHGLYAQNDSGVKRVEDNIFFSAFRHGVHFYGTSRTRLDGLELIGNILFNNGALNSAGEYSRNILVGGGAIAESPLVDSNYSYYPLFPNLGGANDIGYWPGGAGCTDLVLENNYFASPGRALSVHDCTVTSLRNNTIVGETVAFDPSQFPQNQYLSAASPPSGAHVIVRSNKYEAGRAHIVIFNWDRLSQVHVDLSSAGLARGDQYELRNVQNLESDVRTGVYTGAPVDVSMTNSSVSEPIGWFTPPSSFPEFGVFLLQRVSSDSESVDETAPEIHMQSPEPGVEVSGIVTLQASATDDVGVAGVQFYVNGAPVGPESTAEPHTFNLDTTALSDGNHQISASARDEAGNTATSPAITVTVNNGPPPDTTPPSVAVTSPANGAEVSGIVTLQASATDDVGVAGVQFYVDGSPVGPEDTTNAYSASLDTTALSDGNHQISASARDEAGNTATSPAITVTVNNGPPPAPPVEPFSLSVEAEAFARREFGIAKTPEAFDEKYVFTNQPETATLTRRFLQIGVAGEYVLWCRVRAPDPDESSLYVSIDGGDEDIWDVAHGAWSDQWQWVRVNGRAGSGNPLTVNPRTFSLSEGYHTLVFRSRGTGVWLDSVLVTNLLGFVPTDEQPVPPDDWDGETEADTTPPDVSLTNPSNGEEVSGVVTLQASATDDVGVAGVQFYVNGAPVGPESTAEPHTFNLDTTALSDGNHQISASARDEAGNTATSPAITVTVNNGPPPDTTPPSVAVTSPANGAEVSGIVTLQASATDDVGVAGVQFYVDGSPVGPEDTTNAYSASLDTTALSDGNHQISASARDEAGNTATSPAITVTVNNGPPPAPPVEPFSLSVEAEAFARREFGIAKTPEAFDEKYVFTNQPETATLTRRFLQIGVAGEYVLWCRVRAPDPDESSLYVSIDGGDEDIWDVAHGAWSDQWQWVRVNGRAGSGNPLTVNPRTFSLSEGYHTLVFRSRGTGVWLDSVLVTNDMNFVPTDQQPAPVY